MSTSRASRALSDRAQGHARALRILAGCVLMLAAIAFSGCVLGSDSDDPLLSVDLLWDSNSDSRFIAVFCEQTDIEWISWTLEDEDGRVLEQSEPDGEACADGLDFYDRDPGTYALTVHGYDDDDPDDAPTWSVKCTDLEIERFDAHFACRVQQTAP